MYAILMSLINCASMISSQLGGLITSFLNIDENNFDNLWILILIANLTLSYFYLKSGSFAVYTFCEF